MKRVQIQIYEVSRELPRCRLATFLNTVDLVDVCKWTGGNIEVDMHQSIYCLSFPDGMRNIAFKYI